MERRIGAHRLDAEITLLIPTLGRSLIHDCLDSVVSGKKWPGQIIVVDQGGNLDIAGWLDRIAEQGITTRYVRSNETGRAKALNQGLRLVESALFDRPTFAWAMIDGMFVLILAIATLRG